MNLSTLNDDCLFIILKYLKIKDHISLANTSHHLGSIVQYCYRNGSIETTQDFWRYYEEHEEMFNKFWRLISVTLPKLTLEPRKDHHIDLMRQWTLPNLRYFHFSLWQFHLNMPADTLVKLLNPSRMQLEHLAIQDIYWKDFSMVYNMRFPQLEKLDLCTKYCLLKPDEHFRGHFFPKLKTLFLNCITSGGGICTFNNLTELVLEKNARLSPQHVQQILLKCPLKKLKICPTMDFHEDHDHDAEMQKCYKAISQRHDTLEELHVDYHYFCMFAHELPKLKNVRRLHFLPSSYCLCACKERPIPREVAAYLGKLAKSLTIKIGAFTPNWPELQKLMSELINVEQIKIINSKCKSDQIFALVQMLKNNLKEFYFRGVLEYSYTRNNASFDYSGLLNVLKLCHDIEVFDFSETYCDEVFLERVASIIRRNFGKRKLPLVLRFNQTQVKLKNLKKLNLPSFVKISREEIDFALVESGILCEW